MNYIREFLYRPKRSDRSLMARFFFADEALNAVAAELDSFDGRKDPERCAALVHKLRGCQDNLLGICGAMLEQLEPGCREAIREFRAKFPDDVLHENLAGQLWFGAECLAAGSSILNKESESEAMRPLAKAVTKSLERVRSLLREQCLRPNPEYTEKIRENLKIFDRLFSEFEFKYVQCMVHVKTIKEYELHQDIIILFSNTLMRSLELELITQDMVDYCDPSLMFAIPRLAIVTGLLFQPDGPLNVDKSNSSFPELFLPFKNLLRKIRELLQTLEVSEVIVLEMLLCQLEEPANLSIKLKEVQSRLEENEKKEQAEKLQAKLESPVESASASSSLNVLASIDCFCDEKPTSAAKANDAVVKPILDAVISVVIDATNPGEDLKEIEESRKHLRRRRKSSPSSSSSSSSSSSPLDCPLKRVNARRDTKRIPYKFQKDKRARFKSTEDLLHRLYVCISGAADQLQSNYAGDFRSILKTVFLMNTAMDDEEEEEFISAPDNHSSTSSMIPLRHQSSSGDDESEEEEEGERAARRSSPPLMVIPASESSYHIDWGTDALQQEMNDASLRRLNGDDDDEDDYEPSRDTYVRNLNIIQDEENESLLPHPFQREEHEFYRDEPALMTIASGNNQRRGIEGVEVRSDYVEYMEPPAWVPDEAAPICMGCSDQFTIFKRRHHCRSCGLVFCYRCSGQSVPLPQYGIDKPVRVCNRCYYFYRKTSPGNHHHRSSNNSNSSSGSMWTRHFGMVS
ncbi:lateral signaling target protein 2 [Lepeophtheirus salmonis]|uniref:lateral signaling target protein 2 n=1 Tax=Lepeophtheirus salmonis TaxID=72036 RepID=UPI001AE380FE|nr:lateral signaling target protein 2 homolog [Lepeophtheirus salmonis]